MPEVTFALHLSDPNRDIGALWVKCEQAGCDVEQGETNDMLIVTGDPVAVALVVDKWDGEGVIDLRTRPR